MEKQKNLTLVLSNEPDPKSITNHPFVKVKKNGISTPYQYLPISFIENLLDELFGWDGWQTKCYETKVIANELVGQIELHVWSEKRGEWICRTGAAANLIRQTTGALLSDYNAKLTNALEADAPNLLSGCLSNAAKKFGKIFGRDLGRDKTDNYDPETLQALEDANNIWAVIDELNHCNSFAQYNECRAKYIHMATKVNALFRAFVEKNNQLQKTLCLDHPNLSRVVEELKAGRTNIDTIQKHYTAITPEVYEKILLTIEPPKK